MNRKDGKVYDEVKRILQAKGYNTETLQIVTFGRGTYHDIILRDEHIGSYEHIGKKLELLDRDK